MAEKDPESGPSLELPSLFGRRKRRGAEPRAQQFEQPEQPRDTVTLPPVEQSAPAPVEEPDPSPPTAHTPAVTPTPVPTHPPGRPTPSASSAAASSAAAPWGAVPPPAAPRAPRAGGRRRAAGTSRRTVPDVAASSAAFVVGAVVGLAGCVLTYLGLQGCELVTGTDSCGGPGLLVLIAILVAMVMLGAAALRALRVPDAGSISFLGVGVLTVVALVFLIDHLYDPWMFVVVPAVTAVSFALARWVTTLYVEDVLGDDDRMPRHDIR